MIECIFHFMCEKGVIKPFKHGDILAYALQVIIITYSYIFEPDNMTKGFNKTIDTYCVRNYEDARSIYSKSAWQRIQVNKKHGPMNQF